MLNEACQTWKRMMKFPLNNFRENIHHDIKSDSANLSNFRAEVEATREENNHTDETRESLSFNFITLNKTDDARVAPQVFMIAPE